MEYIYVEYVLDDNLTQQIKLIEKLVPRRLQAYGNFMCHYAILSLITASLSLHSFDSLSQNRWIQQYHEGLDAPVKCITESYDQGYLLAGKYGANYSKYNWLTKTNINGDVLWEKTIGDGVNSIVFLDMVQDSNGNVYLCGSTRTYDSEGDPLVMKINPCGEKEWCRIFSTEGHHDFSSCLTLTSDNAVVAVLNFTNPEPWVESICLAKLSSSGELIWKHCYTSSDTSQRNETTYDIILTPDHGFLVTGFCDYEDPTFPNKWWLHPYYLKLDSLGNFEWETVAYKNSELEGGIGWTTTVSPDSLYYYASISHHHHETGLRSCSFVKLDLQGNVVNVYDVITGYKFGKLTYAQFMNDSTLAAEAGWGNVEDSVWTTSIVIDTAGNLLNSRILFYDMYTSILDFTKDDKLLYASNTFQNNQFTAHLTKINQQLEDDTLYSMPFVYDSLCPYQITSDTIVQDDCGLIVGIEEEEEEKGGMGEEEKLKIWPNPAGDQISIKVGSRRSAVGGQQSAASSQSLDKTSIEIIDIFGRTIASSRILPFTSSKEITLDVSSYATGLYIAVLCNNNQVISTAKFVISR